MKLFEKARTPFPVKELEVPGGFYIGKDADQAVGDAVPGSDGAGMLLFADGAVDVDVGAASLLRHPPDP